ncbi:MAG: Histidine kinase [Magnetococcales bacterium]|nr:Histidine kinase [Magnetococcales bacterium]HIJ82872.1 PAS domain S-box protein [Magnetococcales bacterium]
MNVSIKKPILWSFIASVSALVGGVLFAIQKTHHTLEDCKWLVLLGILCLSTFMTILFYRRMGMVERDVARSIQSLKASETRYSTILDTAMDAFISIDANGTILEFNKAAEAMFGYSRDEIVGTAITQTIVPKELVGQHLQGMQRFLATGKSNILNRRIEVTTLHKNGHNLNAEVAITVVPMEQSTFFTAVLRDITQKKIIDERLHLQSAALEAAANPIVITDIQGNIQWTNPAFSRLTGYLPTEVLGQKPSLLKSGEHDDSFYEHLWKTILSGQVWHQEVINKKKDGTRYIQETVITPVLDSSGKVQNFIAIQQDVTDKKRIENERNRFWLAVEQSPVTTIITGPDGLIEYVNPQFCRVTGYSQEEVIGKNPQFLHADTLTPSTYADMWQTIALGKTWRGELLNQKKTGETFWESTLISPIFNDVGKIQHYVAINEDITEKKAYETTLKEARQKADAANHAKSEFLTTMSHEIRTPMNGILGMVELLLDSPLNQQQRRHAQTAYRSAESLLTLLNDILDLSRVEASQVKLEKTPLNLDDLMGEVVDIFSPMAQNKGLALSLRLPPPEKLGQVLGDPVRLRQIMVNLTGNAVKFTENGSVTTHVTLLSESPAEVRLRFEVKDTGIGIDDDAKTRLFQPFVQADSSTTRRYGGSGLGLSIVRKLIDLMGGRLGLDSHPGQGSSFWFEIALEKSSAPFSLAEETRRLASASDSANHFSGIRVLVAEDFEINRDVILEILRKLGCEPHWAEHGRKAVEMADASAYDLIFMDMHMPEMDGITATKHIRQQQLAHPHRPRTPIIAVTADAMSGDREKCLAAGLDDYIAKPYRSKDLLRAIKTWVPENRYANRPANPAPPPVTVAESTCTDSQIFDPGELSNLYQEVGEEIENILGIFLRVLPERVLSIVNTANDPVSLADHAHRLKGGAKTLGAIQLARLCQQLETMAKSGTTETIAPLMDELRASAIHTETLLRDKLKELSASCESDLHG